MSKNKFFKFFCFIFLFFFLHIHTVFAAGNGSSGDNFTHGGDVSIVPAESKQGPDQKQILASSSMGDLDYYYFGESEKMPFKLSLERTEEDKL